MTRAASISAVIIAATGLCSCGLVGKKSPEKKPPSPFGPTGIPAKLRANSSTGTAPGVMVAPGGNAGDQPMLSFASDDNLIFTDPDKPEAGIPELASLLATSKSGPWMKSENAAKQRSAREGKPLLIWFTDSLRSPMCKALNEDLFAQHDFGEWATEHLIRLKVDSSFQKSDDPDAKLENEDTRRIDVSRYNAALKKRYKVLGYPSLIVISPGGQVVGRYRGYKRGEAEVMWGQLKHATAVSDEAYKGWRKDLENKGYRDWEDRRGRKVFARPTAYADGRLTLVEPDGTRSRTDDKKLSDADQKWLAERTRSGS